MGDSAAEIVAEALLADAEAHLAERYDEIGERFDDVLAEVLPLQDVDEHQVRVAFSFWDGWVDARNHDWLYYEGIQQQDWPRHARAVAACLRAGRSPDDPTLQKHFDRPPRTPLLARFTRFLFRRRQDQ